MIDKFLENARVWQEQSHRLFAVNRLYRELNSKVQLSNFLKAYMYSHIQPQ